MANGGKRSTRVGLSYLLLIVLGVAASFFLTRDQIVGTTVTVLLSLPAAYIAWAAFHADRNAEGVEIGKAVDELSVAIAKQWEDEIEVRRVNDPYPLPVAWTAPSADLVESWTSLQNVARNRPGGPLGTESRWAQDVDGLNGSGREIGQIFTDKIPTRRLVILGEAGAGKSVLLTRLLQELITRREEGAPVPVLFSLASWDPSLALKSWLVEQLRLTYPGLRALSSEPVAAISNARHDLAQALLDRNLIMPMLDGFDELPEILQPTALDALNQTFPTQPMVLVSRTTPYRRAVNSPYTAVRLNGAAAIELQPLDSGPAADYLRRVAGGPQTLAAGRWDNVVTQLGTATPVGQALSTPLGLFLARMIYNPHPGAELFGNSIPHPNELCDLASFPRRDAIDLHLFQAFIPAVYAQRQPNRPRWSVKKAQRTFILLAKFLEEQRQGRPDFALWELTRSIPSFIYSIAFGLTVFMWVAVSTGVAYGVASGQYTSSIYGFGFGPGLMAGALAAGRTEASSIPGVRILWLPTPGVLLAIPVGIIVGIRVDFLASLITGAAFALVGGLAKELPSINSMVDPPSLLSLDRRAYLFSMLAFGFACGSASGIAAKADAKLAAGLFVILLFMTGIPETAWGQYVVARTYFSVRHRTPWRLMAFLQDGFAYRGVLRKVGPMYQFRHIDLQRHLAKQQI